MFEQHIQQAAEFIRRISHCRYANNNLPDSEKVSGVQLTQFDAELAAAVQDAFGANSTQHTRYTAVRDSRKQLLDNAFEAHDPGWEFNYWIVYHAAVLGLLHELEIAYANSRVPSPNSETVV